MPNSQKHRYIYMYTIVPLNQRHVDKKKTEKIVHSDACL